MYLSLYCKGSKRVTQGFMVRGSWRPNITATFWPSSLMAVSVVFFLVLKGGPEAHSAGCGLSPPHLVTNGCPNTIGGPEGPFGWVWLSLPHLVSDVSDTQLIRGLKVPLRRAFSTTSYQKLLWTPTVWLPVFTELYNSSIAHSIAHLIFGMACLIVIKRK